MLFPAEKVQEVFTLPRGTTAVTEILLLRQPVPPVRESTESEFPADTGFLCNNISLTAAEFRDTIANTPCILSSSPASTLHGLDSYDPLKLHGHPSNDLHIRPCSFNLCLPSKFESSTLYFLWCLLYRVIHKSLRDFRTRPRNNQDRHGIKEHINR